MIPAIETDRLLLRGWRDDDLDALAAMYADYRVVRYLGNPVTASRADTWRSMAMMVGHWELRGYGPWAVEEKATGALLGRSGLYNPEGWHGLEVGWIFAPQHWGKGFATEAGRASIEWAFQVLGADHVISLIHPDNVASIKVAEKCGETLEGKVDLFGRDVLVYGIRS